MPTRVLRIDVIISSPNDVADERDIVKRVIERLNRSVLRDHFFIVPMLYEEDVPPQVGQDAQLIVDRFMHVQRSQVMVCMLWSRMGTPFTITETGDHFESGTQYEFIKGYESYTQNGHPNILLYRRMQENPHADPGQKSKVKAFFDGFMGVQSRWKGLWGEYGDTREFEEKIRNDLERIIHGLQLEEQSSQWINQPEFEEEARRLDAAIPQEAVVGEPTEVRVMVCLPDSAGLSALLPESSDDARDISQKDVREGNLMIAFPKDSRSGELRSASITIEIDAPDFEIPESRQTIILSPGQDSATVSMLLTPTRARERSLVIVHAKGRALDGGEYLCGSTVLRTAVRAAPLLQISSSAILRRSSALPFLSITPWELVSLKLGATPDRAELRSEVREDSVSQEMCAQATAQRAQSAIQRAKETLSSASVSGVGSNSSEPGRASRRAARWCLLFDRAMDHMLVQVGLLGGEILIPENDGWLLVRRIHTDNPEIVSCDLSQESRTYWIHEDRELLTAVQNRLGLPAPPKTVVVLLSEAIEQRLLRLEQQYSGADESDIAQTVFRVKTFGEFVDVVVDNQQLH